MPDIPQMPRTQRETLTAIWYTIHNGMSAKINETHALAKATKDRFEEVLPNLWTRADHEKAHAEYVAEHDRAEAAKSTAHEKREDRKERRRISAREWIFGAFGVVGVVGGIIIPLILGR